MALKISLGRDAIARQQRRSMIAIAVCAISAVLGAVMAIYGGWSPVQVEFSLGTVWCVTADWLGRRFALLRMTPAQIYQRARQERVCHSPLVTTILTGSLLFFVAGVICLVKSA